MLDDPQLELTYKRFFPLMRAKSHRVLGAVSDAEDVAQETFIRFWQARDTLPRDPDEQLAWIYRVGTRLSLDALRRRAVRARTQPVSEAPMELDSLVHQRRLLSLVLERASGHEVEFAVMSRLDGLTHLEIARTCGVSERTVRRELARFDARARALEETTS